MLPEKRETVRCSWYRYRFRLPFPDHIRKEVYSDLTGERGVLMGALAGIMEAQYDVLRKNGHSL